MARSKKNRSSRLLLFVVLAAIAGAAVYFLWFGPGDSAGHRDDANSASDHGGDQGQVNPMLGTVSPQAYDPNAKKDPVHNVLRVGRDEAVAAMQEGLKLAESEPIKARGMLSKAYNSLKLSDAEAARVRTAMTDLANRTLFNGSSYVNPADAYTEGHTFDFNEYLSNHRDGDGNLVYGIIHRRKLWVPSEGIVLANGLVSSTKFQAGKTYKMLKGPFHVIVYKDQRVMDVYLQDLFVRRMPVCIGAPETPTPEGRFVLTLGGKTKGSKDYPPVNRGRGVIRPGEEGYPLDPGGHNMKIEGIVEEGTTITEADSYAIHGTNEEDSIGKAESLGCVRLGHADIAWLYKMLYESKSTVTIRP